MFEIAGRLSLTLEKILEHLSNMELLVNGFRPNPDFISLYTSLYLGHLFRGGN